MPFDCVPRTLTIKNHRCGILVLRHTRVAEENFCNVALQREDPQIEATYTVYFDKASKIGWLLSCCG